MDFSSIFDVFSKRPQPPVKADRPLTREFRYRVLRLCTTTFPDRPFGHALSRSADTIFWLEMYEKLSYLHGRARLAKITTGSLSEDAAVFLGDCNDYHFLDFIEPIFKWQRLWDFNINPHEDIGYSIDTKHCGTRGRSIWMQSGNVRGSTNGCDTSALITRSSLLQWVGLGQPSPSRGSPARRRDRKPLRASSSPISG